MFERFTDHARRAIVHAQEEAREFNHGYIGTEHLLAGLTQIEETVPTRVLLRVGITPEKVREQIEDMIGHGNESPSGHIPFTPRSKKVMELSLRESLQLGHNYIGAEHLALALVREGEGVGIQILVRLGLDGSRLRSLVINELGLGQPPQDTALPMRRVQVLSYGRVVAMSPSFEASLNRAVERAGDKPLEVTHFRD